MSGDFKSHLPVQTHKDGADFTASSDYTVGVGGYESVGGTLLTAAVSANREWLVKNAILESIVHAEDAGHSNGDKGALVLGVRNDTLGALAGTDLDYIPLQFNAKGELYVHDTDALTKLTSIESSIQLLDDTVYAEDSAHASGNKGNFVLSVRHDADSSLVDADGDYAPLQVDATGRLKISGTMSLPNLEKAEDSAHVSGDKGIMSLGVRQDSVSPLAADGDYIPLSMDKNGALRVTITDPNVSAAEIHFYDSSVDVAVSGTAEHDYTVTALKTLQLRKIWASASGRIKAELILDPTGTPETVFTGFNSTANPNIDIPVEGLLEIAAGTVVRVLITNMDEDTQNVYSTILGTEI